MMQRKRRFVRLSRLTNRGFTLVEMLIAMVVILIILLGLVQAALLSIEHNLRNLLRDEAVRIAEQRMNGVLVDTFNNKYQGLRNLPFDDPGLNVNWFPPNPPPTTFPSCVTIARNIRNIQNKNFTVCTAIANAITTGDAKSIQVSVGWDFKNEVVNKPQPTGREYQHSVYTILRKS